MSLEELADRLAEVIEDLAELKSIVLVKAESE